MKINRFLFPFVIVLSLLLGACSGSPAQGTSTSPAPTGSGSNTPAGTVPSPAVIPIATGVNLPANAPVLTVLVHDSFAVTESLIVDFEKTHGVKVSFIKGGDAGAALNRAILTKGSPIADVFYGLDNTFLSRALDEGIYDSYNSALLQQIPDAFKLDPQNRALPVDYGDVCINYDKAFFKEKNLAVPNSFEDLTKPAYKGLLVMENPATSSPGLAFLLATLAHFGPDQYLNYWKQMRGNGLSVVNDWETAYYTNFSGSSGKGPQPMVVSYGTSPAAEVIYATQKITEAPTASIVAPGMCFRQEEFVGILKGTKHRALAEKFVDFMLSVTFQQDMPEQMFVFPINPQSKLPESFLKYVQVSAQPASLSPAEIAKNRNAWIEAWTSTVLR